MIAAIMQPYLFPYLGYFQLMGAADVFVIHDDVQWIRGGWINRNRVLLEGEPHLWTLPVERPSSTANINACKITGEVRAKRRLRGLLETAYRPAPFFAEGMALIEQVLACPKRNVAEFITHSIDRIAAYLDIRTRVVVSSQLLKDCSLRGQARVIDICTSLGALTYCNPIAGAELYQSREFAKAGLSLKFLESGDPQYPQLGAAFVPRLSIIDVVMFNSVSSIRDMLARYDLR